jgi:16S rRNA (cytosine967-C5)-methyltransferase
MTLARRVAADALLRVHQRGAWASPVVDRALSASALDARDRAFAANLVFSALRWEGTLDWVLGHVVARGVDGVEPALLDVLRLGTWELRYGGAPAHAAVSAWVDVAGAVVGGRATGFANGVLRAVARRGDDLPWPDPATAEGAALALGYPRWVVEAARDRFGERGDAVLSAGNEPAPIALRAVAPVADVLAGLSAEGVAAAPGRLAPQSVLLDERGRRPADLAVVRDGAAVVQDESSQVVGAVAAAGLPAGARAVDLCAAPGGKATHMAQLGLAVLAMDRHPGRLARAARTAARTGLALAVAAADGRHPPLEPGRADVVLVDAPCSGLGVVRRRPELRWRRRPEDVPALHGEQVALLRSAVGLVRPGGRVVYAVCTWTEVETDAVVAEVLADGTVAVDPAVVPPGTATAHGRQLAPDRDGGDGMYVAVLQREG